MAASARDDLRSWRQLGGSNAPRAPVGFTVAELATPLQHLLEQLEQLEGG
jgi:hypothetical protein